jgi:putative Mn2+ efflux pump MntP
MSKNIRLAILTSWLLMILGILYIISSIEPNQELVTSDDAAAREFRRECEVTLIEFKDGKYHMVCEEK